MKVRLSGIMAVLSLFPLVMTLLACGEAEGRRKSAALCYVRNDIAYIVDDAGSRIHEEAADDVCVSSDGRFFSVITPERGLIVGDVAARSTSGISEIMIGRTCLSMAFVKGENPGILAVHSADGDRERVEILDVARRHLVCHWDAGDGQLCGIGVNGVLIQRRKTIAMYDLRGLQKWSMNYGDCDDRLNYSSGNSFCVNELETEIVGCIDVSLGKPGHSESRRVHIRRDAPNQWRVLSVGDLVEARIQRDFVEESELSLVLGVDGMSFDLVRRTRGAEMRLLVHGVDTFDASERGLRGLSD